METVMVALVIIRATSFGAGSIVDNYLDGKLINSIVNPMINP